MKLTIKTREHSGYTKKGQKEKEIEIAIEGMKLNRGSEKNSQMKLFLRPLEILRPF